MRFSFHTTERDPDCSIKPDGPSFDSEVNLYRINEERKDTSDARSLKGRQGSVDICERADAEEKPVEPREFGVGEDTSEVDRLCGLSMKYLKSSPAIWSEILKMRKSISEYHPLAPEWDRKINEEGRSLRMAIAFN